MENRCVRNYRERSYHTDSEGTAGTAGRYETAAVLTITDQEAWEMAAILKKELGDEQVTYMNKDSSRFKKGITVTTFYLAKGLEFDQVLLSGADSRRMI